MTHPSVTMHVTKCSNCCKTAHSQAMSPFNMHESGGKEKWKLTDFWCMVLFYINVWIIPGPRQGYTLRRELEYTFLWEVVIHSHYVFKNEGITVIWIEQRSEGEMSLCPKMTVCCLLQLYTFLAYNMNSTYTRENGFQFNHVNTKAYLFSRTNIE